MNRNYQIKNHYKNTKFIVSNVRENNYRLVVVVVFFAGEVNIRFAGTHAEYSKINVLTI